MGKHTKIWEYGKLNIFFVLALDIGLHFLTVVSLDFHWYRANPFNNLHPLWNHAALSYIHIYSTVAYHTLKYNIDTKCPLPSRSNINPRWNVFISFPLSIREYGHVQHIHTPVPGIHINMVRIEEFPLETFSFSTNEAFYFLCALKRTSLFNPFYKIEIYEKL